MKTALLLITALITFQVQAGIEYRADTPVEAVRLVESSLAGNLIEFNLQALESVTVHSEEFGAGTAFRMHDDGGYLAIVGAPDLPALRRMVRVPDTGGVEVAIVSSETVHLGRFRVAPYQQPPTYTGGAAPYRINTVLYGSSEPFPSVPVEIESVNILRDVRVASVRFCPVSVNPVTGDVYLTTSALVEVRDTGGTGENELFRAGGGYTRSFLPVYDEVLGMEPIAESDVVDGSYVFIGSEESIGLAQSLVSWKAQKGYNVEVGLLSEIGGTVSEIDGWLEDAFTSWPNPPEYVMLVGGANVVPTPYYTGSYTHAADNEYAVVGSGAIPSMHIGRICGNDTDDLAYISWKIHQHEMAPYQPSGENWFMRGFSLACTDFEAPQEALRIHQLFMEHAIQSTFYCNALGGVPPTLSLIVSDINEGVSVINYIGHGTPTAWVTTGFSNSDIAALENDRRMPWVFTIGCQNGQFDTYYSFCEAFLSEGTVADPRGAIATMGSSTYTPVGPGDTLQIHTFRGYFTEELHHFGAAHTWGKIKCQEYFGGSAEDMIMMTHLFGCPESAIYNDTSPVPMLSNDHSPTIGTGPFPVTVTDDTRAPVEGALVAAYYADTDELLDSGYTNSSGVANLSISGIPGAEQVTITSTAYSRHPCITYADPAVALGEHSSTVIPSLFLGAVSPNPVTSTASISFGIPVTAEVELTVYDLSGRAVSSPGSGQMQAGTHTVTWNGASESGEPVPNGVYFMRLTVPEAGSVTRTFLVAR